MRAGGGSSLAAMITVSSAKVAIVSREKEVYKWT